jgi:hypothetical protein
MNPLIDICKKKNKEKGDWFFYDEYFFLLKTSQLKQQQV